MIKRLYFVGLFLSSVSIHAQPIPLDEPLFMDYQLDLNNDGIQDRVSVVTFENLERVLVFHEFSEEGNPNSADIVAVLPLSINSDFDDVEANEHGGFNIFQGCGTCGNSSWRNVFKVIYRDGKYIVSGYETVSFSRLTTGGEVCDVNLLNGDVEVRIFPGHDENMTDAEIDSQEVVTVFDQAEERAFPLKNLSSEFSSKICNQYIVSHRIGTDERNKP